VDISGLDYSTEYTWYVNVTDGTYWKHKVFDFQAEHKMVFDPFDEGWQYRKQITIDHMKVTGNLMNFPVLISTIDTDLRDKAQDDGDDILFMDDPGVATRLYHEIEHFDGSSGELVAWVNVTDLASDQDTVLYLYYGNPSCFNQQAPELVWDSKYIAVWHFTDTSDSTANNWDLTLHNTPVLSSGKIGDCYYFDENDQDYLSVADILNTFPDSLTFESWRKKTDDDDEHTLIHWWDGSHKVLLRQRDDNTWDWRSWGNGCETFGPDTPAPNIWYYMGATYTQDDTSSTAYCFLNKTKGSAGSCGTISDTDGTLYIGAQINSGHFHMGYLDEYRLSDVVRSDSWISTEYNNQNDPSSFLSFGPEETGP